MAENEHSDKSGSTPRTDAATEYPDDDLPYVRAHVAKQFERELAALRRHDLYKTGDAGLPETIIDRNGEVVLGLCKRCGKGEADLAEACTPHNSHSGDMDAARRLWHRQLGLGGVEPCCPAALERIAAGWRNGQKACSCGYPHTPCTRTQTDCAVISPSMNSDMGAK